MELAICTDVYADLSYREMLDKVKSLGINAVEMTAGGWGARTHVNTEELLTDEEKRRAFLAELETRGMRISALNMSGNPLWPSEEDTCPNWITSTMSLGGWTAGAYEYQWKTTIAFWKELIAHCKKCGVEQIAIEEFPGNMVWSAETLLKLREATDPMLGINLDPSHMMILGADPIAAARALKGCIFHVHGKDARIERGKADINGIPEPRFVEDVEERNWNYVAVGCGHDLQWWKEFFSVVHMMGYNGDVSLEMEDLTMTVDAGVETSIEALKQTISR